LTRGPPCNNLENGEVENLKTLSLARCCSLAPSLPPTTFPVCLSLSLSLHPTPTHPTSPPPPPPPSLPLCSESVPSRGGERALRRHRHSAVGETWAGWGSMPVVLFPGGHKGTARGLRPPSVRPNHLAAPWRRRAPWDVPPPWGEGFGIPNRSPEPLVRRAGRDHPFLISAGSPGRGKGTSHVGRDTGDLPSQGAPHGRTKSGGIALAVIFWSPCAQKWCYKTGRCDYQP
jgi:hypothetical protein